MKILNQLLVLLGVTFLIGAADAQHPLEHLTTEQKNQSLTSYVKQSKADQWFVYSIPAPVNTPSMCCFEKGATTACDLNRAQGGYGSSSSSPTTDNIHVFVHLDQGQVQRIMPVGDHCEVKAKDRRIDWLSQVNATASIDWLSQLVIDAGEGDINGSLYTLSLHADPMAAQSMYELASNHTQAYSEQAIFWLGQRTADGFVHLEKLLKELPVGESRKKINFALSQHQQPAAISLLKQIAQQDPDQQQQADAVFWLSQTKDIDDVDTFLLNLIKTTDSSAIKERAVFSLSQLPNNQGTAVLFAIIQGDYAREIKKNALFWLSQSDDDETIKQLESLL